MKFQTVWISDVHLGTRACKAKYLKHFLKNVEADTYYLVGDIIDCWALKNNWFWSTQMNDVIRLILKKSKRSKVVYVIGNHDTLLREFMPLGLGNIEFVNRVHHTTASGQRIIVLHGDIFDAFIGPKYISFFGPVLHNLIVWGNNIHHWLLGKLGIKYWSLSEWVRLHTIEAQQVIQKYEETAAQYAKNKGYDGIIVGHIHQSADKEIDGVRYLNCGDWVSSCTALVEENGQIRLFNYKEEVLKSQDTKVGT